jgi:hypothetical protein
MLAKGSEKKCNTPKVSAEDSLQNEATSRNSEKSVL